MARLIEDLPRSSSSPQHPSVTKPLWHLPSALQTPGHPQGSTREETELREVVVQPSVKGPPAQPLTLPPAPHPWQQHCLKSQTLAAAGLWQQRHSYAHPWIQVPPAKPPLLLPPRNLGYYGAKAVGPSAWGRSRGQALGAGMRGPDLCS